MGGGAVDFTRSAPDFRVRESSGLFLFIPRKLQFLARSPGEKRRERERKKGIGAEVPEPRPEPAPSFLFLLTATAECKSEMYDLPGSEGKGDYKI